MKKEHADRRPARHGLIAGISCAIAAMASPGIAQEPGLRAAATPVADAHDMSIARGRAEVLRYDVDVGTVVIGDPAIAVASLVNAGLLVLTALSEGETNAIVFDEAGREIDRISLRVRADGRRVVVWRGLNRDLHVCETFCVPVGNLPAAASQDDTTRAPGAP